jgi:sugar (pentulose or hexulose) kinase
VLQRCVVVLDAGKTNAKLTLWDPAGRPLARRVRPNGNHQTDGYRALDAPGIENWVIETLSEFARLGDIGAIIPVGHGAAAALILGDRLFAAPMDYEQEIDTAERDHYVAQRDSFRETGSPLLPQGLNLGIQLHHLERLTGPWPDGLSILPWPQYWAWRFCGVRASEVSSLGCHTDLWKPLKGEYSDLAERRGWSKRMAPLRAAGEELGYLSPEWTSRTGTPEDCVVLCGLHDSNAALLAARGHSQIRNSDATVLSTGTWFVAMRSPLRPEPGLADSLPEHRDCLINVDVDGKPVPSARFMGGREIEILAGNVGEPDTREARDSQYQALMQAIQCNEITLPGGVAGVGPYPKARRAQVPPREHPLIHAHLYAALLADASLDLIGSCDTLLIEGRFSRAPLFARALATLRPTTRVLVSSDENGVARGALRVAKVECPDCAPLTLAEPLAVDITRYRDAWRDAAERAV